MLAWAEDESRTWQLKMGNHSPGLPPYKPSLDTSLAAACWSLADKWVFWDQRAVSDCRSAGVPQTWWEPAVCALLVDI